LKTNMGILSGTALENHDFRVLATFFLTTLIRVPSHFPTPQGHWVRQLIAKPNPPFPLIFRVG
jgi:hypothetical protein